MHGPLHSNSFSYPVWFSCRRKIPQNSQNKPRGLYFSKVLFKGLIFGRAFSLYSDGAYLRREICVSKSVGLALQLEVNLSFLLYFTLHLRYRFGGLYLEELIHGRVYFRNFTVNILDSIDSNVDLLNGLGSVHEKFDTGELGPTSFEGLDSCHSL